MAAVEEIKLFFAKKRKPKIFGLKIVMKSLEESELVYY